MSKSTEATDIPQKQNQKHGGNSAPNTNQNIPQMKKTSQLTNGGQASPMLMNGAQNAYECFSGNNPTAANKNKFNEKMNTYQIGNLDITENDSHDGEKFNQNVDTYNDNSNIFYFNNANQFKIGKSVISDGQEYKQTQSNMQVSSQSTNVAAGGSGSAGPLPTSNKSDVSIAQNASHSFASGGVSANQPMPQQIIGRGRGSGGINTNAKNTMQMAAAQAGSAEAKRKRKNSEKQKQRKASNNRRSDKDENMNSQAKNTNGLIIPPIMDNNQGNGQNYQNGGGNLGSAGGQQRSQSRGTTQGAQQNSANQGVHKDQNLNIHSNHQVLIQNFQQHHQQYYDPSQPTFNPFQNHSGQQNDNQQFGLGLGAMNGHFPFGNGGTSHFMGGGQAPQVHFIAKKQQFIAQISPEQLINSDKRPYTAQSLNNLSTNAKRAGGVYAQHMHNKHGAYMNGGGINNYNMTNAAFQNHAANILGGIGARTHTNGFSFHPATNGNSHKYSISLYGEEVKPKIAGKDIVQVLSSSNGFSGYQSDPYNSVMSGSLPASINHAVRLTKTKASQNRLQKDKEQLYDETIKMKMLNNQLKDDSVKLKTKIKILENELNRKEKTIEDLFSHNQLIQQSQLNNKGFGYPMQSNLSNGNGQNIIPFTQTAQKYQQETFLVMSLKKQIRELKFEVVKRDEELEVLRKNIKNTRTIELEQEIQTFRDECMRLRTILEELMKQGASHPIHQQAFQERINSLQSDINSKDQLIQQLYERLNQTQQQLETSNTYSPQVNMMPCVITTNGTTNTSSLAAVKSQDSNQQLESSPSAAEFINTNQTHDNLIQQSNSQQAQQTFQSVGREKSGDRKNIGQAAQNQQQQQNLGAHQQQVIVIKDVNKELQKAKKNLREKEKEILKLKQEINQIRRESQEKLKNDGQQNNLPEQQVKTLKDRISNQKQELKRRDEKLNETDQRIKKMEEQLKSQVDILKSQEDQNKLLKSQLRAAKNQKQKILLQAGEQQIQPNGLKQGSISATPQLDKKEEKAENKDLYNHDIMNEKEKDIKPIKEKKDDRTPTPEDINTKKSIGNKKLIILDQQLIEPKPQKPKNLAQKEFQLMTLIGQREKLSRDDLTSMILAGEESLKMLIREPSEKLIDFIKAHLDDENGLLNAIPRFEMPKTDFESQVLREMRLVLRDNSDKISDRSTEELMKWSDFEEFYNTLENFDYPHKDKLLDFIKYFFLDHIVNENLLMMNYQAFKEHLNSKRGPIGVSNHHSAERTRNGSSLRSRRKSGESAGSFSESAENSMKRRLQLGGGVDDERANEEERMLDIAEQCFMRIADLLHARRETVKQAFGRYAQPEPFKDGTVLELMTPRGFLVGVRELGFEDVSEMEAACLLKVLAKPELDGAVILNEFILIMENFGIPALTDEDEYENDYIPDSDSESMRETKVEEKKDLENEKDNNNDQQEKQNEEQKEEQNIQEKKDDLSQSENTQSPNLHPRLKKNQENLKNNKQKYPIVIDFEKLEEKSLKVLKKLARFLLERYMHPREFFGPTIKKEIVGKKKCKVEVIKLQDFYLRLKLASIRKKLKEKPNLNQFLSIDGERFPGFVQVKRLIKTLEIIAEGEQENLMKEQEKKEKDLKEKLQKEAQEREEQGLPPLSEEEVKNKNKPKTDPPKLPKKGDKILDSTPKKAGLEEVMKLGGRGSPSNLRDRDGHKLGSHLGLQGQLNTIEEDLHETQTSHYSQQLRDGDISERGDISKHQLSTSNHLRNSNMLNELEDSSRRSNNGGIQNPAGARNSLPNGVSVQSVDYSGGGSQASPNKSKLKLDEYANTYKINEQNENFDEQDENDQEEEDNDQDQKMKDELDAEVDKKYMKQLQSTREKQSINVKNCSNLDLNIEDVEEEYDDEKFYNRQKQIEEDYDLKEDTIKTEKIEQIVDEDLKMVVDMNKENIGKGTSTHTLKHNSKLQGIDEYQEFEEQEEMSIDELDLQTKLNDQNNTCQQPQVSKKDQAQQDSDIQEDYDYEF